MSGSLKIKTLSWDHPDATCLRDAQQLEINGVRPMGPGIPATAANVPVFLVAYQDDNPVGCGGLRPLASSGEGNEAEIKRMYVVPSHRGALGRDSGRSVAQIVLEALEQTARNRGWVVLKVETSKAMFQARKFYEKFGYRECDIFGGYIGSEHSICFGKHLN